MIIGSSALNNASNQQVVSPAIEIKLTNSYTFRGISFGGYGGTFGYGDAVFWKNHYYVYDKRYTIDKYSFVDNGLSLVASQTIPGISWNIENYVMGRFVNEGNTLSFYGYLNCSINSHSFYRYYNSDGLTWTSRDVISSGVSYPPLGIAPVIGNAVYMMQAGSGTSYAAHTRGRGQLWLYRRLGPSTWGGTIMYNKLLSYPTKNAFGLEAIGTTDNMPQWGVTEPNTYEDYIYYNYTGTTAGGASDLFMGMRVLDSNRLGTFNERDKVTNNGVGYLNIIPYGMKKGLSYYYHYFKLIETSYRNDTGFSTQQETVIGYFYEQSRNGINWTLPRYVGPEYFNDSTRNYLSGVFAAGGATVPEMMIFTGQTAMCLWYETNEVDISSDVTTYSNRDNETLSITLGNYR